MNSEPLVSVLSLCYNQAKFCAETLDSIYNQSYKNIELILIDDCSSDNSINVINNWIAKHPNFNISFQVHKKNQGICKSLNECIRQSKGKYISLIACDDIMMPHKLKRQVKVMEQTSKEIGVLYSDATFIDEYSKPKFGRFIQGATNVIDWEEIPQGNIVDKLIWDCFIPAPTCLIKRVCYEKVGLYDENLAVEDHDMWIRMASQYKFIFDSYESIQYRWHSNNTTKKLNNPSYEFFYLKFLAKHIDKDKSDKKNIERKAYYIVNSLYRLGHYDKALEGSSIYLKAFNQGKLRHFFIKYKFPILSLAISELFGRVVKKFNSKR